MKKTILLVATFLVALSFLESQASQEVDCSVHSSYCQIIDNRPDIDRDYAMRLSNIIHDKAKKYNLPKKIFTAILMQESRYDQDAIRCTEGYDPEKDFMVKACTDIGIAQIHIFHIKSRNLNAKKLITDLEYSVGMGAKILSEFKKRYSGEEPDRWYCRYYAGTGSQEDIAVNCDLYLRLVRRWM